LGDKFNLRILMIHKQARYLTLSCLRPFSKDYKSAKEAER